MLAERSALVDAALTAATEQCATEAEFENSWRDLKALKHEFVRARATQALAVSLASREPFADLDRARRNAGEGASGWRGGVVVARGCRRD